MLVEPTRTPYDLNFRLFGFDIRVHPMFWLFTALLGWRALDEGIEYLLIWVAVVFVSILVHELGHAIAFRRFGSDASIVLYAFGGLAIPYSAVAGRWRRIVVALAGPIAGFILYGLVYLSQQQFNWALNSKPTLYLYISLIFVNLYWGIFNLLPVYPLDGGHVSRELCTMASRRRGTRISLEISILVAGLVSLYGFVCHYEMGQPGGGWLLANLPKWMPIGTLWTGILFAILAFESYQLLQQVRNWDETGYDDDRPPWR